MVNLSDPPVWGHQEGVTPIVPICSDFPVFFRFVEICVPCFLQYPDLLRSLPICSDLLRFVFRTNEGNPLLLQVPHAKGEAQKSESEKLIFVTMSWLFELNTMADFCGHSLQNCCLRRNYY